LLYSQNETLAKQTPIEDKVAVLITGWMTPDGYSFDYSWNSHSWGRVGDRTEYPGQPCKIGHVGSFPFARHMGLVPYALTFDVGFPPFNLLYDNSGIYKLEDGVYVSPNPDIDSVPAASIPPMVPITPAVEITGMDGSLTYPPDPRTGEDLLPGYYKIGAYMPPFANFPNGFGDFYEGGPLSFKRYYGIMGGPTEPTDTCVPSPYVEEIDQSTKQKLEHAFGDRVDVRLGSYNAIPGCTVHMQDVAEDFANEGFRKMLIARETTDNNHYANEFFSGNYVKERLCELGVLDETEIYHTRQVGRTPEFNTMNIMNLKRFIEAYPEGSTIAIIHVTRGLPWDFGETSGPMGGPHPWSKEVYHENAYLNSLSLKKALQNAYGDRYDLVFTKGGVESDLHEDSLYTYGLYVGAELGNHFQSIRSAIQAVKDDGIDKMIIVPAHWRYDNLDNIFLMREPNGIPVVAKEDLVAGNFDLTYCEDAEGNEVPCDSEDAVAEISVASSYSHLADEFATSYYVRLRGTLERFGLYPMQTNIQIEVSQLVTKLGGGTVEVTQGAVEGAKIEIPGDPYPDRPQTFTRETAIPVNDPSDTYDCLWEDVVITIGHQANAHGMQGTKPLGEPVYFGPYRTIFNRDVTITLPYDKEASPPEDVSAFIYNDLTNGWDSIPVESVNAEEKLVTAKTKVLGLFQVGELMEP